MRVFTRGPGSRRWALAGLAATLAAILATPAALAQPVLGPAPRGEDGRFTNTGPLAGHGGLGVRLPFFMRRIGVSFRPRPGASPHVANDGAFLRENARHSVPTVTWIGHATLLVQMGHTSFLTDPMWSKRASPVRFAGPRRLVPPGVALDDLPPIDFVLISHNHYDHLDLASLEALARRNPEARFIVPLGNSRLLRSRGVVNVDEMDWGEVRRIGAVEVHCLPARHWSQRGLGDGRRALWASWAVTGTERRFYFGGDTGYFDGFSRVGAALGPFDLAALPIGAYEPEAMMKEVHLNPEEAVQAGVDLRARALLGVHFGTFDLADEPLDEPPRRFRDAALAQGLGEDRTWVFQIGETRPF